MRWHVGSAVGVNACDFCLSSPIEKLYPCLNFVFNGNFVFLNKTHGHWATCNRCSELVESRGWAELIDRSYNQYCQLHGPVARYDSFKLKEQYRELVRLFREHQIVG